VHTAHRCRVVVPQSKSRGVSACGSKGVPARQAARARNACWLGGYVRQGRSRRVSAGEAVRVFQASVEVPHGRIMRVSAGQATGVYQASVVVRQS